MYRTDLNPGHKGGAILAVAAVHAALLFVLLNISGTIALPSAEDALQVINIAEAPPPPPPPPPPPEARQEKPTEPEGGSSPNIKSEATPVVAPKPVIVIPKPSTIVVAEVPGQGAESTQGASTVRGPGTGAGGSGTGTGSGSGAGAGAGGGGGYVVPPRLLTPDLRGRDFPREMLRAWPRGAQLFARVRVDANGSVIQCIVDRGTGIPPIDSQVCGLIQARFRYSPARNAAGQAVAGWSGYRQIPPR